MCASNTPCLDDSGQCTSRCIPLAASWCQGLCPNALQYVPSTNPVRSWSLMEASTAPFLAPQDHRSPCINAWSVVHRLIVRTGS